MIDSIALLSDCRRQVRLMEEAIRERLEQEPAKDETLQTRYGELKKNGDVGEVYLTWKEEQITQSAVSWVLATVFVRYLEDNGLAGAQPWISGCIHSAVNRLEMAEHQRMGYFHKNPRLSDREYLHETFTTAAKLPGCSDLFGKGHNPLWTLSPTADACTQLLRFWQEQDPATGEVRRLLVQDDWSDTRFLGDLYQDLSESARKRYALLQTPDFVEEFILDYTLTPAMADFGLLPAGKPLRMIDPTCGSGHFVLGAFRRLLNAWLLKEPGTDRTELVQRALASVHGIDINPFAVAIARLRLVLAALHACGGHRLQDLPAFSLNLATGDSLLLGTDAGAPNLQKMGFDHRDFLVPEDYELAVQILHQQQYHVVVGNPPYISIKDSAVRDAIKRRYPDSCFRKWTLSTPFIERFFELTMEASYGQAAGYMGQINSNAFTKREFGKKLIETVLPRYDISHVIDTSGCYIPGHGTPTLILFGRNRPTNPTAALRTPIRTVQGIRGEPARPEVAAEGEVWRAIVEHLHLPGSATPWVSVADVERSVFAKHPWSLGGGGAGELKEAVEQAFSKLGAHTDSIGFASFSGTDDLFLMPSHCAKTFSLPKEIVHTMVTGDDVRDWRVAQMIDAVSPYS